MKALIWIIGMLVISASSFFILGYVCDKPGFYTIPSRFTPVALPTSVLFMLVGVALILLATRPTNGNGKIAPIHK